MGLLTQKLINISKRFIGRVKFTSQDLNHFSHTSVSGQGETTYKKIHMIIEQNFTETSIPKCQLLCKNKESSSCFIFI